ncbi:hypothetical protein B0J13DRAFT_546812 [Dactylonectria estremocensis]|uniref:Uncharacterized protein n=1 Tax=Dactylonectria estremocensis TaxID=1079267 RepID=A0A9P9F258_9HYPO|nr:hypothetical protein B0J13DRAFT_546812 [Dactylonectria estremocensis]
MDEPRGKATSTKPLAVGCLCCSVPGSSPLGGWPSPGMELHVVAPGALQPSQGHRISHQPSKGNRIRPSSPPTGGLKPATPITQDVGRTGTQAVASMIQRLPQRRQPREILLRRFPSAGNDPIDLELGPRRDLEGTPNGCDCVISSLQSRTDWGKRPGGSRYRPTKYRLRGLRSRATGGFGAGHETSRPFDCKPFWLWSLDTGCRAYHRHPAPGSREFEVRFCSRLVPGLSRPGPGPPFLLSSLYFSAFSESLLLPPLSYIPPLQFTPSPTTPHPRYPLCLLSTLDQLFRRHRLPPTTLKPCATALSRSFSFPSPLNSSL